MPVHRIVIRRKSHQPDPRAEGVRQQASSFLDIDIKAVRTADVYLLEGDLSAGQLHTLATKLLADPVSQDYEIIDHPEAEAGNNSVNSFVIEVHPLPGVMDPVAQSVEEAARTLLGVGVSVRSGVHYEFDGVGDDDLRLITARLLANPVVQQIHHGAYHPESFPHSRDYELLVQSVLLRGLDDAALVRMSREAHLFLSLEEMRAVQGFFDERGREPTDIELETIAQTWSEHCVHKTLKSTIRFTGKIPNADARPGHVVNRDETITIHNLMKSTIAAATNELMADGLDGWLLSVFVDNAGIIKFDDEMAVCFKVETHNHPSALEPYGGAATGIGGCIRDIIGTGLAAKPIASTDIFCVGYPNHFSVGSGVENGVAGEDGGKALPAGCLHPRRILTQIAGGVRDYGNRMGIPTVNGAVYFDDRYVGNPLVYVGCVGEMPIDKTTGDAQVGDHIIVLGGRTGRDGIHGATFSSAELTDSHADEFSHAVQIGNAITEKKTLDAILKMRDHEEGCLFSAITDCGAGGFSSAVGEMGEEIGADVYLDRAPLKYDGLSYTEIWISEAQERMVLAVPERNIAEIRKICEIEEVEVCDLGTFGTENRELILNYGDTEVGRLAMGFLHDGIPTPTREARWEDNLNIKNDQSGSEIASEELSVSDTLLALLAHPNIASKHWIVRQYDHEVQGRTVVKPFVGEDRVGPSDGAVMLPKRGSYRGLAIANGLATGFADDPYAMTTAAVDECVRNLVCVGTNPKRIAILDNFCWPSCGKPENLGMLVLAAEACYDSAKAFRTPFISGKDSLNNQFTTQSGETIEIPPTLLISGFGIVKDVRRCVTMDAKQAGNLLVMVGETTGNLGGAHLWLVLQSNNNKISDIDRLIVPQTNLELAPRLAEGVADLIEKGFVKSAHDCSEGGVLVAAAEMAFAGKVGLDIDLSELPTGIHHLDQFTKAFAESTSRYLLEVKQGDLKQVSQLLDDLPFAVIGEFNTSDRFTGESLQLDVSLDELVETWRAPLDW